MIVIRLLPTSYHIGLNLSAVSLAQGTQKPCMQQCEFTYTFSHPLPPDHCSLGTKSLDIVVAGNFICGTPFTYSPKVVIYRFYSVPLHHVLCSPKYTPIAFVVRLGNWILPSFFSLTCRAVVADPQTGCILLDSNSIIFLDYILLFISETSESTPRAPGCYLVLNQCLAAVVVLTLIRAYKHRTCSSSSFYLSIQILFF